MGLSQSRAQTQKLGRLGLSIDGIKLPYTLRGLNGKSKDDGRPFGLGGYAAGISYWHPIDNFAGIMFELKGRYESWQGEYQDGEEIVQVQYQYGSVYLPLCLQYFTNKVHYWAGKHRKASFRSTIIWGFALEKGNFMASQNEISLNGRAIGFAQIEPEEDWELEGIMGLGGILHLVNGSELHARLCWNFSTSLHQFSAQYTINDVPISHQHSFYPRGIFFSVNYFPMFKRACPRF